MIELTKMNHDKFLINYLQIECIELIPETKVVMMNHSYYLVRESADEIVQKIAAYTAKVADIHREILVKCQNEG
ncbi:MAG: flagellar FlbD family protein [Intestinimonas sp.]|nr:flagellar FlbD family protein [Intestinimonas sp.]